MSIVKKIRVECKNCGKVFYSQTWTYVNAETDVWLKEKIISGETLRHRCPQCKTENWKETDFLYFDPQREFLIFLLHERLLLVTDETVRLKIGDLPVTGKNYKYRQVSRHKDLVEKIIIFDHGLHDYPIELLKELLTLEFLKEDQLRLPDEVVFSKYVEKEFGPELHFAIVLDNKVHPMMARGGDYEYAYRLTQEYALPEFRQQTWKSVGQEFVANFIPYMLGEQIRRNQLKNLSQEELQRRINLLAVELKKDYPSISALLHVAIPIYINNSIVLQYENSTVAKIAKERENTFQDVFRKYLGKDVIAKVTMIDKK